MLKRLKIICNYCGTTNSCTSLFCSCCGSRIVLSNQIDYLREQGASSDEILYLMKLHGDGSYTPDYFVEKKNTKSQSNISYFPKHSGVHRSCTTNDVPCHSAPMSADDTVTRMESAGTYVGCLRGGIAEVLLSGVLGAVAGGLKGLYPQRYFRNHIDKNTDKGCEKEVSHDDIPEDVKKSLDDEARDVNSSIFAPSEVSKNDYMLIQVYLYKDGEDDKIAQKATLIDPEAEMKNFTPLDINLKDGDEVNVNLLLSSKELEATEPIQTMIWHGHYTDCQFDVFIPEDYKPQSIVGTVILSVNNVPIGSMKFKSRIVDKPRKLYAEIERSKFNKVFISYSHEDYDKVKFIHEGLAATKIDHFFDRSYLRAGDVYPKIISDYIENADLFVLCWSENAKNSDYVQLEKADAMKRACPDGNPDNATLALYPLDIEPHAELPEDMNKFFNFGRI